MQNPVGGDIGFEDAMAALGAIERNLDAGLFPTTGGAVSLMGRREVDMLRKARKGAERPLKPVLPDRPGRRARGRDEWYVAAIEQALLYGSTPYDESSLLAMDAMLEEYRGRGVDWKRIHALAVERNPRVPAYGDATYWTAFGEPRTVRAFSAPVAAESSPGRRWAIGITVGVVAILILSVATARHWTKVDVPEQAASSHFEQYETGAYDVSDSQVSPCWIGQDWTACANSMVDQYNAVCAGVELTLRARMTCDAYGDQITWMQSEDRPGWYVTSLPGYGYLARTAEVSSRQVSNNDFRPAVTHQATCYLGFLGECS